MSLCHKSAGGIHFTITNCIQQSYFSHNQKIMFVSVTVTVIAKNNVYGAAIMAWWCNGNERDWWPKGPRIDSESGHCQVTTLGKLFTHVPLFTKQYTLILAKGQWCPVAGKVTVGLVSHWPCITDSVVYPPTGSTANVWEMSTLPMLLMGHGLVWLLIMA